MRSRSLPTQHDAAVARRLELLTTELADARRGGPSSDTRVRPASSWSPGAHTRIRAVPAFEGEADEPAGPVGGTGPAPSVARLPGRHASRRPSWSWADVVPEGLQGRFALGPGQVAVVAVVVAAALAVTCWWLVRSGGHEVAAPTVLSTPGTALATPESPGVAPAVVPSASPGVRATPSQVVVYVSGKVRRPGIAVLRQGARVVDALRAAGGARPGVALGGLNLAQVLTDGEQIAVGGAAAAAPMSAGAAAGSPVGGGPVDINTADETTLESLPDVGPVTAAAVIAWRTQHGGFSSVDQLLDVDGIGDATLAKLAPLVTI